MKINLIKRDENKKVSSQIKFTILAIILIAIFSLALTPVTFQNDTFYTIKIGELIQNNGIDMMDHFSWHENLPYEYPHWLYDLITYWIYSLFSFDGIFITTAILSCILGVSIYLVDYKLTKNNVVSFFVAIGVMYLLKSYITARAQLVTFILFIWEVYFIEKYLENKKLGYGIGLILISLLIANLHIAVWPFFFVVFLPYIAEYVISVLSETILYHKIAIFFKRLKIKRLDNKILKLKNLANEKNIKNGKNVENVQDNEDVENYQNAENYENKIQVLSAKKQKVEQKLSDILLRTEKLINSRKDVKPYKIIINKNNNVKALIIIMIICALMGLITPLGDAPYTYLYKTMQGNTTQNINEHLPMTIAQEVPIMCALVIFLAFLIFTKAKIRLSDLFMIGGLTYLMLCTKRQSTIFAIIGSIVLVRIITDSFKQYNIDYKNMAKTFVKPVVMIALIVVVSGMSLYFAEPKFDDTYIDETAYPVQACDFIINYSGIDLENARFYNEYNYGSYMLFRGIPVFIDSRADLYTPEFSGREDEDIFSDFLDVSSIGKFYEDIFEKYGITHVITYENSKMNMIIRKTNDSHYNQIYGDDYFVVYERIV